MMVVSVLLLSCTEKRQAEYTPWGTPIGQDTIPADDDFSFGDIVNNGQLIMLTLSGPETYYDYHGHGMGLHYLLCDKFAQKMGVELRVEVCKDTAEMVRRLANGDGDIIAFPLPRGYKVDYCGVRDSASKTSWCVKTGNRELADSLNSWFKPAMTASVKREESFLLSTRSVRRHVYSPMLNRSGGVISRYDRYFQMYAPMARWDWRLMAAQCYQESTFDPQARSWAGACGLMQIMPSTATHLGLPHENLFDPEANIAAAAKYIQELSGHFGDVRDPMERIYFVLASYNGGFRHIRDAMALARKHGRNPYRWGDVSGFVEGLTRSEYYTDPVVNYGYMRGYETTAYVERIRQRWASYRGAAKGGPSSFTPLGSYGSATPKRAKRHNKYKL